MTPFERLVKWRDRLIEVSKKPPKRRAFNMLRWHQTRSRAAKLPHDRLIFKAVPGQCNSMACAVGFAALMPAFKRDGFRLVGGEPTYGVETQLEAVSLFFGISRPEARFIAIPETYGASYIGETAADVLTQAKIVNRLIPIGRVIGRLDALIYKYSRA